MTRALMRSTQIAVIASIELVTVGDKGARLDTLFAANLTPILFILLALWGWLYRQQAAVCEFAAAIISLAQALQMALIVIVTKPFYMPIVGIG